MQSECVNLDDEIKKNKQVIVNQQLDIEKNEERNRANNLMIFNLPESEVKSGNTLLKTDADKIALIAGSTGVDLNPHDVVSAYRVGKKTSNNARPLKVVLKNKELKHRALRKRKDVAQSSFLYNTFGVRVYINPDVSFLVQRELHRLRQSLKEIKTKDPESKVFIRSGALFLDGTVIDEVKVENQLF